MYNIFYIPFTNKYETIISTLEKVAALLYKQSHKVIVKRGLNILLFTTNNLLL